MTLKPSISFATLNVLIVRHVGARLNSTMPVLLPVLMMLKLPGTLNAVAIATFAGLSALHSGMTQSNMIENHQGDNGGRLIS